MNAHALIVAVAMLAGLALHPAAAVDARAKADFLGAPASADARQVADWALASGDPRGMPFVIVDKVRSQVFVFEAGGRLLGASPALVGLAAGDDTVAGIGSRKMSAILPHERTTPAGRFVASLARNLQGDEILWVDYAAAIALHRVYTGEARERRLQRLAGPKASERRITYGCINVPVKFFDEVIAPAFKSTSGIVYVLPETRPWRELFGSRS